MALERNFTTLIWLSDVETVVEHNRNIFVPDSDAVKEAFKCKVSFIFLLSSFHITIQFK